MEEESITTNEVPYTPSEQSILNSVDLGVKNDYINTETKNYNNSKSKYINDNQSKKIDIPSPIASLDAEDFYSGAGSDINVGTYSGSVVGSVPIFSSYYRLPFAAMAKNRKALIDQKYAILNNQSPTPKIEEISTDANYDEEFRNKYLSEVKGLLKSYSNNELNDPSTEGGMKWLLVNQNYKARSGKINASVKSADDIIKLASNDNGGDDSYIPKDALESAYIIKQGMANPYLTPEDQKSLDYHIQNLDKGRSISNILKQVIPTIQKQTDIEYFGGNGFVSDAQRMEALKDDKYNSLYHTKLKTYYDRDMAYGLASSIALDNPAFVYQEYVLDANGNKIKNPTPRSERQYFTTDDLTERIFQIVGKTQEKENFVTLHKSQPTQIRVNANSNFVNPEKKTPDYNYVSNVIKELAENGNVNVGESNITSGKDGTVSLVNGKIVYNSWNDPISLANSIHGIASSQQNIVDQTTANFNSNTYDASLPYGGMIRESASNRKYEKPLISSVPPVSNQQKVTQLVSSVGSIPINSNITVKSFVGTDKDFSFDMNVKSKEEKQYSPSTGVFVPSKLISNPNSNSTFVTDGEYIVYPNSRYHLESNGMYSVQIKKGDKWENLKPFKDSKTELQIPSSVIDGILSTRYKEVSAVMNKKYTQEQSGTTSTDALGSATGTKNAAVSDIKKVNFSDYDNLLSSFSLDRNKNHIPNRTSAPLLNGFKKVLEYNGYSPKDYQDKKLLIEYFNEWKKSLTPEDYKKLQESSIDNKSLYEFYKN